MGEQIKNSVFSSGLIPWEAKFQEMLVHVKPERLTHPGSLLSVIPSHQEWDNFIEDVKQEWGDWRKHLEQFPCCLVVLFGGLAFFEYEDNRFWPQFAKAIGKDRVDTNEQIGITSAYSHAVKDHGLPILQREGGKSVVKSGLEIKTGLLKLIDSGKAEYVGSAVYQIGIPLSLWSGFLEVCEWAIWREDWQTLSENEWTESVGKRAGGRQRLKRFLIDNREVANAFIKEMLDAREILIDDSSLKVSDLSQASLLRQEYFEEVPETADFLRPRDPESLFQDRARLVWNERQNCLSLHLPGIKQDRLPATWIIGSRSTPASSSPNELVLDSIAFDASLYLQLRSEQQTDTQRLHGVNPWALFDLERGGYFVNLKREQLPMRSYILVSAKELRVSRNGFEENESPANEFFQLSDETNCFVTRLWPTGKNATLMVAHHGSSYTVQFRTRSRIEARFFMGRGKRSANFLRHGDEIETDQLPMICVVIPTAYFNDNQSALDNRFQVCIDKKVASGIWKRGQEHTGDDRELYFWNWGDQPILEQTASGTVNNFQDLKKMFRAPDLKGKRCFSVESREFKSVFQIDLVHSKKGIDSCWKNLPGAFLPWFLLCQSAEGLKWEELMLAKDVIAPEQRISYYLLRKYEDHGMLEQRNRRWIIAESRAVLNPPKDGKLLLTYCGNPSILWGLYRKLFHLTKDGLLPVIDVIYERGELPYLQMIWESDVRTEIQSYLKNNGVYLGHSLWNR